MSLFKQDLDQKFLSYALKIATKNLGLTAPNPCVGCVIVKDGKIIATGVTAKSGRPHGEINAINSVKNKDLLKGATLYVTLEPCCHKADSCTDIIIESKISRVVVAVSDPDSRMKGAGLKKLRHAGIEVVENILSDEAKELNKAFFKVKTKQMPYVTLKIATTLDGKIATKDFDSKWISSEKSRLFAHYLRSINDAILVGANTLNKDNPALDCRIKGLEEKSPRKIVVSGNLQFRDNLQFFDEGQKTQPIIVTGKNNKNKINNIKAKVIFADLDENGNIDFVDVLQKLAQENINSVLVEGGGFTATQFLQKNLIDELVWIRSGKIIGNDGIAIFHDLGYEKISQAGILTRVDLIESDGDLIEIYKINDE